MGLAPGLRLGPYEILSPIGAGGMGEVYAARDARLDRRVAIKVLAAELASDRAHLARFTREAKAASALNHPNIVSVLDVGESDSVAWVAMELIEGKTLGETLNAGPLATRKLLDLAGQIAEGLAAAHDAGIVHRDLKPANVMVTREGFVKILDFGLARGVAVSRTGDSSLVTESSPPTMTGEIVGTAGYMSPEQARGEAVDFRSDQFSFGSVLYEMATGKRAFRGNTRIDTLAAVLNAEPEPIARLRPGVPPPLRWVIERCHSKSATDRYQSTRDLARELRGIREHLSEVSGGAMVPEQFSRRRRVGLAAGALAVAILTGAALWTASASWGRHRAEPQFRRLTLRRGAVYRALFAPGSNSILYTAAWEGETPRTFLTMLDSFGADRALDAGLQLPLAFSPDGSQVLSIEGAFRPTIAPQGALAWWPALGGQARRIVDGVGWADWAPRGRFFAAVRDSGEERRLEILDAQGTLLRSVFRTAGAMSYVRISPDEKQLAFIHHTTRLGNSGEVRVVNLDGSESRPLTSAFAECFGLDWNRRTGEIWFTASHGDSGNSALWSVGLSKRLRLLHVFSERQILNSISATGDRCLIVSARDRATLVVRRVGEPPKDLSWFGWTWVHDLSPDGRTVLFYDEGRTDSSSGSWLRSLDGGEGTPLGEGLLERFSPDGASLVGVTASADAPQLILLKLSSGETRTLTSDKASYSSPSFVDAQTLLFVRSLGRENEIWTMGTDGGGGRSHGTARCDLPVARPGGGEFLCVGGERNGTIFIFPLRSAGAAAGADAPGRRLYSLEPGERFKYARWNGPGNRIFAVTSERLFLTLDAATGAVIGSETLPVPPNGGTDGIYAAAFNADASIQAYSTALLASELYLVAGIE